MPHGNFPNGLGGLGRCIQMPAWADEQSKTSGGDPVYALERSSNSCSQRTDQQVLNSKQHHYDGETMATYAQSA